MDQSTKDLKPQSELYELQVELCKLQIAYFKRVSLFSRFLKKIGFC